MSNVEVNFEITVVETTITTRTIYLPIAGTDENDAVSRAWRKAENGDFDSQLYFEKPVITGVDREYKVS